MIFFLFLLKHRSWVHVRTTSVLTSTHGLCFRAKIRKNEYPCKSHFYYIKVGCKGVFVTRTCFRDGVLFSCHIQYFVFHRHLYITKKLTFKLSCVMRKPAFCIYAKTVANHIGRSQTADQRLRFGYIYSSISLKSMNFQQSMKPQSQDL